MITFSNVNLTDIQTPHDDLLIVSVIVANYEVKKVLMDSMSAINILFYNAFVRIKLLINRLTLL